MPGQYFSFAEAYVGMTLVPLMTELVHRLECCLHHRPCPVQPLVWANAGVGRHRQCLVEELEWATVGVCHYLDLV